MAPDALTRTPRNRRPRRRLSGWHLFLLVLGLAACGSAAIVGTLTIRAHARTARSAYTQAHGVRDSGTVLRVVNDDNTDDGPPTAQVTIRLQVPVGGHDVTTASVPALVDDSEQGRQVPVLVDPQDPSYAEYPGRRFSTSGDWLILLWGFLVLAILGVAILAGLLLRLLLRREG